jgi:hypothetical protein
MQEVLLPPIPPLPESIAAFIALIQPAVQSFLL